MSTTTKQDMSCKLLTWKKTSRYLKKIISMLFVLLITLIIPISMNYVIDMAFMCMEKPI